MASGPNELSCGKYSLAQSVRLIQSTRVRYSVNSSAIGGHDKATSMISDLFRMTPRQFRKAAAAGVFEDTRVELLGGIVFRMVSNPPHRTAVLELFNAMRVLAPPTFWYVTKADDIEMGQWIPAPDLAILRGPESSFHNRRLDGDEVALIAEVSDTTYKKDRGLKLRRYASCGIPTYWIIDLNRRVIEVDSMPAGRGRNASYQQQEVFGKRRRLL
jgi:Uma2 family endonuclease